MGKKQNKTDAERLGYGYGKGMKDPRSMLPGLIGATLLTAGRMAKRQSKGKSPLKKGGSAYGNIIGTMKSKPKIARKAGNAYFQGFYSPERYRPTGPNANMFGPQMKRLPRAAIPAIFRRPK